MEFRSFQVNVAPGAYTSFTILASFSFFLFGYNWAYTTAAWLLLILVMYTDKPLVFILFSRKLKLYSLLTLLSTAIYLPGILFVFGGNLKELIGMILIPVGGLSVGLFMYCFYTEKELIKRGWSKKSN